MTDPTSEAAKMDFLHRRGSNTQIPISEPILLNATDNINHDHVPDHVSAAHPAIV
jgi:hypothetical protein